MRTTSSRPSPPSAASTALGAHASTSSTASSTLTPPTSTPSGRLSAWGLRALSDGGRRREPRAPAPEQLKEPAGLDGRRHPERAEDLRAAEDVFDLEEDALGERSDQCALDKPI